LICVEELDGRRTLRDDVDDDDDDDNDDDDDDLRYLTASPPFGFLYGPT